MHDKQGVHISIPLFSEEEETNVRIVIFQIYIDIARFLAFPTENDGGKQLERKEENTLTMPPARNNSAAIASRILITLGLIRSQKKDTMPIMLTIMPNPPAHAVKPVVLLLAVLQ